MSGLRSLLGTATFALTLLPATARADEDGFVLVVPAVRFGIGPALHLAPEPESNHVDVMLDVSAGADLVLGDRAAKRATGVLVNPEIGYTYDGLGLHAFHATVGVGMSLFGLIGLTYNPRLVAGTWNGPAIGMRNGVTLKVLADTASMEIGHQFVADDLALHHAVNFVFAVNPGALAYVIYRAMK